MTKIKLYNKYSDSEEITTFEWLHEELKFVSYEEKSYAGEATLISDSEDGYFENTQDKIIVENYLKICDKDFLKKGISSGAIICFNKEILMGTKSIIKERWLDINGFSVLKETVKGEFCSKVLPLIDYTEESYQ